ncbi:unnamed protein product, partial [Enterobius vermicularis]|uniref:RBR-type E3 ubiquitin transferase n=1 Tax=Enterobius vermicularis TaxID=51028 RepID=A0A158QBE2_ENTVE
LCCADPFAATIVGSFAAHVQPWSGFQSSLVVVEGDGTSFIEDDDLKEWLGRHMSGDSLKVNKKEDVIFFKLKLADVEPLKTEEDFIDLFGPIFHYLGVVTIDISLHRHCAFLNESLDEIDDIYQKFLNYTKSLAFSYEFLRRRSFLDNNANVPDIDSGTLPFNVHVQRCGQNNEFDATLLCSNEETFEVFSRTFKEEKQIAQLSRICKREMVVNFEPRVRLGVLVSRELLVAVKDDLVEMDHKFRLKRWARIALKEAPCKLVALFVDAEEVKLYPVKIWSLALNKFRDPYYLTGPSKHKNEFRLKLLELSRSISCLQLSHTFQVGSFPLECAGCQTKFSVGDLKNIFLEDEKKSQTARFWHPLAQAVLKYFISRNSDKFFYCPTPDCLGVYKRFEKGTASKCLLCGKLRCSHCGEDHKGLSCANLKSLKGKLDSSLSHWLRYYFTAFVSLVRVHFSEDLRSRRLCPNCQSPIEKVGGCYHMECPVCKKHFCWVCLFSAETSGRVYEHTESVHKTCGVDLQLLINEVYQWDGSQLYIPAFEDLLLDDNLKADYWRKNGL